MQHTTGDRETSEATSFEAFETQTKQHSAPSDHIYNNEKPIPARTHPEQPAANTNQPNQKQRKSTNTQIIALKPIRPTTQTTRIKNKLWQPKLGHSWQQQPTSIEHNKAKPE